MKKIVMFICDLFFQSPDVFFKIVKEQQQHQITRQVQNTQEARPKPIPSSDVST